MAYRDDSDKSRMADFVSQQVRVDERGRVQLFGKTFKVDPKLAPWVDMGLVWATSIFYQKGGTLARQWATKGSRLFLSEGNAAKVGLGAEWAMRLGGPMAQTLANMASTLRHGYKEMRDVSDQASVLLAANQVSGGGHVLTNKFSALAHKRAQVRGEFERGFLGSFIGGVSQLPALMIGYNQYYLDRVQDPELAVSELSSSATKAEKDAAWSKYASKRTPRMYGPPDKEGKWPVAAKESAAAKENNSKKPFQLPPELQEHPVAGLIRGVSWIGSGEDVKSMFGPQNESDYTKNLNNLRLMPPVVALVTDWLRNKFVTKGQEKFVAWDCIKELEGYIENHKRPDRDKIAVFVKTIFRQHIRDLGKSYEPEGIEFENAVSLIASDIQYGKLNPQALAEVLDNKKIVSFNAKEADFGDEENIRSELTALEEKYAARVSEKDFYAKAPFTRKNLVEMFNNVPDEEKAFFVMLVPPGVLEKAGADAEKVKQYREEGKQYFVEELTDMTRYLLEKSRHELKALGIKGKLIDELDSLAQSFKQADRSGNGTDFVEAYQQKVGEVARNIGVTAGPAFWRDYIKDRAESAASEEMPTSRKPIKNRKTMDMAERDADQEAYRW